MDQAARRCRYPRPVRQPGVGERDEAIRSKDSSTEQHHHVGRLHGRAAPLRSAGLQVVHDVSTVSPQPVRTCRDDITLSSVVGLLSRALPIKHIVRPVGRLHEKGCPRSCGADLHPTDRFKTTFAGDGKENPHLGSGTGDLAGRKEARWIRSPTLTATRLFVAHERLLLGCQLNQRTKPISAISRLVSAYYFCLQHPEDQLCATEARVFGLLYTCCMLYVDS